MGLTQEEVARRQGVPRPIVCRDESEWRIHNPGIDSLAKRTAVRGTDIMLILAAVDVALGLLPEPGSGWHPDGRPYARAVIESPYEREQR